MSRRFCSTPAPTKIALFRFLVLPVFLCLVGCSDKQQIAETEQRGNRIVDALETFRSDNGHYPQSLLELSPKYLSDIPSPIWGLRKWEYQVNKGQFELGVNESIHTGDGVSQWLRYYGRKHWEMGD